MVVPGSGSKDLNHFVGSGCKLLDPEPDPNFVVTVPVPQRLKKRWLGQKIKKAVKFNGNVFFINFFISLFYM